MPIPTTNLLLDVLSPESRDAILAQATFVELPIRTSIQAVEEVPRFAYFPLSGMASVTVQMSEGDTSEVALIAREGMTGTLSLLGSLLPPTTTFMQIPGTAWRVPFAVMRDLFDQSSEIRGRILQSVQHQAMTTTQMTACNGTHEAESRLARWLLMVGDRTQTDSFSLTQEFMAEMLGARRTTVAVAAGTLRRTGFIEYSRGRITIRSREDLESAACECYPVTRRLLDGLYGETPRLNANGVVHATHHPGKLEP